MKSINNPRKPARKALTGVKVWVRPYDLTDMTKYDRCSVWGSSWYPDDKQYLMIPISPAACAARREAVARAMFNDYCNACLRVKHKPKTLGSKRAFLALADAALRAIGPDGKGGRK